MTKADPSAIDVEQLTNLALAVIKSDRFPYLATVDGDQARLRPVSPVRTDRFTVYVANLRRYHRMREIAANPKVELCYLNDKHKQVRITGVAETVTPFSKKSGMITPCFANTLDTSTILI